MIVSLVLLGSLGLESCKQGSICLSPDGFIAEQDTLYACDICGGDILLQKYDTLYYEHGKCNTHKLSPPNPLLQIDDRDTIFVGIEPDNPPFYFMQTDRELGFAYELIQLLLHQNFPNKTIQFRSIPHTQLERELLKPQSKLSLIFSPYLKNDVQTQLLWSEPICQSHYALITRKEDITKYKNVQDLNHKKVGIYRDKTAYKWASKYVPTASFQLCMDNKETEFSDWMQVLVDKKVDAIIYDYPLAVNEIGDYNQTLSIANACLIDSNFQTQYALGVSKNAEGLLTMLNQTIYAIKTTSSYQNLATIYLPNPKLPPAANPNWNDEDIFFNPKTIEKTQLSESSFIHKE